MKNFALVLFFFITLNASAQIVGWDFDALTSAALTPTTVSANVTESNMSFGSGLSSLGNQGAGSGCGQSYTSASYQSTFSATDYWEFTLTPDATYEIDVTSIDFTARVSNSALTNFEVRYNIDSYSAALGSGSGLGTSCAGSSIPITMSPSAVATTFRIYFWGATAAGTTLRIDDLSVFGSIVLPITLLSLNADKVANHTLLSFSTATERNNAHFSIERSADGSTFSEIGRVTGKGTTTVKQDYTFTDERPLKGINYYRLRQVDFDGTASYSGVVSVVTGRTSGITVAPSPAVDQLKVRFEEATAETGRYEVFDQAGRLVLNGDVAAESNELNLEVAVLMTGIYTLRVTNGRETMTKQFRKE